MACAGNVWVAGCAVSTSQPATPAPVIVSEAAQPVPPLTMESTPDETSALPEGDRPRAVPAGWEPWILHPTKRKTKYRFERVDRVRAMRADADASASGLVTHLAVDPLAHPILEWRWRVGGLVPGADIADRHAEDAPVRVVLAFDGDKRALPLKDRLFFEQVKFFSGRDMPYATLMYVWENRKPIGTVVHNPHTARVRKIVVASGDGEVGQWISFRRDIVSDYQLAYGSSPGRLIGIAILTDTDNTRERVTSWYGDIRLVQR
jgi:hypothetical protein